MQTEDSLDTTAYIDRDNSGFHSFDRKILDLLLKDMTTGENIIWATDDYVSYNPEFTFKAPITSDAILSVDGGLVRPRVKKSAEEQTMRVRDKAEVFTPSWICNDQNNLVDEVWFGYKDVFNTKKDVFDPKTEFGWIYNPNRVRFPDIPGKNWKSYVKENRLEITCGEAPYLVSRYDASSGNEIPVNERIGLLDRKLRIVGENISIKDEALWFEWVQNAYKSTYGYEWQGDNLLLARENLLYTFIEYYGDRFHAEPSLFKILEIARIIIWNIWQMDGIKCVIPNSCTMVEDSFGEQLSLFDNGSKVHKECPGCVSGNIFKHSGIYSRIIDWETNEEIRFVDLYKEDVKLYTAST